MAFLLPVVHAPFFSDDIVGSQLPGYRELHGDSLLGLYFDQLRDFITKGGRPQFLSGIPGYPVINALGDDPTAYHTYLLAFTALDAALLYGLLRRLRVPAAAGALVIVLAAAWMQQRIYHDSLISFAGLVQTVLALTIGSVWCFARWLDDGRTRDMVLAVALFVAACAIYEIAYTLCVVHVLLALTHRRGRAALRASAPFLGVAALFALASVVLRRTAPDVNSGYTLSSGGPWTVLRTYAVQLVSPLPDMSIVSNPEIGGSPSRGELFASVWRGLAVAGAVVVSGTALVRAGAVRWAPAVAAGFGLYLAPPAMLAVAGKYQAELDTARAYLPVLMQVFGLAILATAAFGALLRLAAGRSREMVLAVLAAAALFAGLTGGVTAFNNIRVLGIIQPDRAARALVEAGADRGAFAQLPSGASLLFTDRDMVWQGPTRLRGFQYLPLMLVHHTGRVYDARMIPASGLAPGSCPRTNGPVQPDCAAPESTAAWSRVRLRRDGGTVIVAPLDHPTATGFPRAQATGLVVYRQSDNGDPSPPPLVGTTASGRPWTSMGIRWRRLDAGDGWALYAGTLAAGPRPVASSLDDPSGFVDFTAMPPAPERARLMGTRRLLP